MPAVWLSVAARGRISLEEIELLAIPIIPAGLRVKGDLGVFLQAFGVPFNIFTLDAGLSTSLANASSFFAGNGFSPFDREPHARGAHFQPHGQFSKRHPQLTDCPGCRAGTGRPKAEKTPCMGSVSHLRFLLVLTTSAQKRSQVRIFSNSQTG